MRQIESKGLIRDFKDLFKGEKNLTKWIVMFATRSIGISSAQSFVQLWMVGVKGADPVLLGFINLAGLVTAILLQVPMGRLSDKIGRGKTFFLLRPFTYIGDILVILSPGPGYLIYAGVLGGNVFGMQQNGGIGQISQLSFITMEQELVPAEKRGRWYGILALFQIVTFPATILAGYLWQQGLMIEVLLLPTVLELLIVFPLLLSIPDTMAKSHLR